MYNAVIFNSNLFFIIKYCNILFNNFENIKLVGIASNSEELSFICNSKDVNLIILDSESSLKSDLHQSLNNIGIKIIISNNSSIIKRTNTLIFPSNIDKDEFINVLNKFLVKYNSLIAKKKIHSVLTDLGFNFKLKGTTYLLEAILYSYLNNQNYIYDNLEKNIYPHIAKKFNVNLSIVKHSIVRSINNANVNSLKKHFNYLEKFTNKILIIEIVNLI